MLDNVICFLKLPFFDERDISWDIKLHGAGMLTWGLEEGLTDGGRAPFVDYVSVVLITEIS